MKLARIRTQNGVRPALIAADGTARDISSVVEDITAQTISNEGLAALEILDPEGFSVIEGAMRLLLMTCGGCFVSA